MGLTKDEKIDALKLCIDNINVISLHKTYNGSPIYGLCGLCAYLLFPISEDKYYYVVDLISQHLKTGKYFSKNYLFAKADRQRRKIWLQQQIDKLNQQ